MHPLREMGAGREEREGGAGRGDAGAGRGDAGCEKAKTPDPVAPAPGTGERRSPAQGHVGGRHRTAARRRAP